MYMSYHYSYNIYIYRDNIPERYPPEIFLKSLDQEEEEKEKGKEKFHNS